MLYFWLIFDLQGLKMANIHVEVQASALWTMFGIPKKILLQLGDPWRNVTIVIIPLVDGRTTFLSRSDGTGFHSGIIIGLGLNPARDMLRARRIRCRNLRLRSSVKSLAHVRRIPSVSHGVKVS